MAALIPPTYAAFETGVEEARTYFAQRRRIPDGHLFPHIYGPIEQRAVIRVVPFPRRPDGTYYLQEGAL